MSATADLESYIQKFKAGYKKYLPSETSSVSSLDTEELLSDTSSEVSSVKPKKVNKVKSISSLKKRKKYARVNKPTHMKPYNNQPLNPINEEEETDNLRSTYLLENFMPKQSLDIKNYLPQVNKRVSEALKAIDMDSDTTSMISSADTEDLLQSSDEEQDTLQLPTPFSKTQTSTPYKPTFASKSYNTTPLQYKSQEGLSYTPLQYSAKTEVSPIHSSSKKLSFQKTSDLAIKSRKLSTETTSIGIAPKKSTFTSPSAFFNSLSSSLKSSKSSQFRLCTCILKGSLFKHFKDCRFVEAQINLPVKPVVKPKGNFQAATEIQRAFRDFNQKKKSKLPTFGKKSYTSTEEIEKATQSLYQAIEELKNIRNISKTDSSVNTSFSVNESYNSSVKKQDFEGAVCEQRHEVESPEQQTIEGNFLEEYQDNEVSDCDTEELLNSTFSSIA